MAGAFDTGAREPHHVSRDFSGIKCGRIFTSAAPLIHLTRCVLEFRAVSPAVTSPAMSLCRLPPPFARTFARGLGRVRCFGISKVTVSTFSVLTMQYASGGIVPRFTAAKASLIASRLDGVSANIKMSFRYFTRPFSPPPVAGRARRSRRQSVYPGARRLS